MTKLHTIIVAAALTACLPTIANAENLAFIPGAGFKDVAKAPDGERAAGFWDNRSYDSWTPKSTTPIGVGSPCTAGAIVFGGGCNWKALPEGSLDLSNPRVGDPKSLKFLGTDSGENPESFSFTGPWALDFAVLFQLTAWDTDVEFGWYQAGHPDNRTSLLPKAGRPSGPYSANDGHISPDGSVSVDIPEKNFGFYYKNTRHDGKEFLFFTESQFNHIDGYFPFFNSTDSGMQGAPLVGDLDTFRNLYKSHLIRQQFALFTDGSGRYWLGLEDQIGQITDAFCSGRPATLAAGLDDEQEPGQFGIQPCSDYDYNDLILSFTADEQNVPEPATLTLLGAGLLAAAWARRRAR